MCFLCETLIVTNVSQFCTANGPNNKIPHTMPSYDAHVIKWLYDIEIMEGKIYIATTQFQNISFESITNAQKWYL